MSASRLEGRDNTMTNKRPVFAENDKGELIPMRPSAPPNEDVLQELIASHPDIVGEEDGELLLVCREQGVPGDEDGSDRWSLDHLFVTGNSVPVLIEVKRASDTRIRREVVGQLLDYAANGVSYWPPGTMEKSFRTTCESSGLDPDQQMALFLDGKDAKEFWEQVDSNLGAGRLRLVVAADVIPPELARVIEFLNEQMRAEVRAIELRYYESEDGRRTLVPRVIGDTERSRSIKGPKGRSKPEPITLEEWINKFIEPAGPKTLSGAQKYINFIKRLGGEVDVASTQGSLYAKFQSDDGANVWPFNLQKGGLIWVSFSYTCIRPGLQSDEIREDLLKQFDAAVGGLSTANTRGFPSFPASRIDNPKIAAAFEEIATKYIALAREAGSSEG